MRGRVFRDCRGHLRLDYADHRCRRRRPHAKGCRTEREGERLLGRILQEEADLARDIARGVFDGRTNDVPVETVVEAYLLHQLATKRYGTVRANQIALGDTLGHFGRTAKGLRSLAWPPRQRTPLDAAKGMARRFVPGPLEVHLVSEITTAGLEAWAAARRHNYAPRTLDLRVRTLKACLTWAASKAANIIKTNPASDFVLTERNAQRPWRALTEAEVAALLAASPPPYRDMWLLAVCTGTRHGELVRLTWLDVSFATNTIRIRQESSKAGRRRDVPMPPQLRARLLALKRKAPDPEGVVFLNAGGRPWRNNLMKRFAACAKVAGIISRIVWHKRQWWLEYTEDGQTVREPLQATSRKEAEDVRRERRAHVDRKVVIHSLRHSYATALIRRGENARLVADLLGHSSVTTTLQTYAHTWPTDTQRAVAALPFGREGRTGADAAQSDAQMTGNTGTYAR